jgi:carbamate kinase
MKETDKGYRRVVASPKPLNIVEHREIQKLIELDFIVICCGGGGIPVVRKERKFRGVEAVIDKDLVSSVLAREIKADIFVIASDVEGAAINWGKTDQKMLRKVPLAEMEKYVQDGQFAAGSMGPKVDALVQFFNATGKRGVICQLKDIEKAIAGEAGTEII